VGELYLNWSTVSLVFLVLEALLPLLWLLGNISLFSPKYIQFTVYKVGRPT
jgi:hypothetical protein